VNLYGHMALRRHLQKIPDASITKNMPVYFQASSLGSLGYDKGRWLAEWMTSVASTDAAAALRPTPPLNIIYPTIQTVRTSKLGEPGAGTTILQKKVCQLCLSTH